MDVVLVPDKFKGSLPAREVCAAIAEGIRQIHPGARFRTFAASDGGDGFLAAIRATRDVELRTTRAEDPLGRPIDADWLMDPVSGEAFVEMARASGLVLLEPGERDPGRTGTRGTGLLIRAALEAGARSVYVGLGGSATNDGGIGLAHALGYRFLGDGGRELAPVGGNLGRIVTIRKPRSPAFLQAAIYAVCDVTNPLWGPDGATYVYGPQKGAAARDLGKFDRGLRRLDRLVARTLGADVAREPGAGAAGGAAYGLRAFLDARILGGTEFVFRLNGIAEALDARPPDILVTGEGRIDGQSLKGKLIQGVIRLGRQRDIPVVAVCGTCTADRDQLRDAGLAAVVETADPERSLEWNMEHAYGQVVRMSREYFENR